MGQWESGTGRTGQGDNAQCDNGIWGAGTKEQRDNVTVGNGTMISNTGTGMLKDSWWGRAVIQSAARGFVVLA